MTARLLKPLLMISALLAHVLLTARVWGDIASRSDAQLRGSRTLWRVVTALNAGNHLIYLLVGRRRP